MSMTSEAYERIRDAIVSGGLELGEHLSESQIAAALGMSKAPVRAAFIELRDKGLVTVVPQSGTYVFSPSPQDVRAMSDYRVLLEDKALRDAMRAAPQAVLGEMDHAVDLMRLVLSSADWDGYRRADNAFHMAFLSQCGNPYILRAHQLTSAALEALRVRLQGGVGNFRMRSFEEHLEMVALLRAGDVDSAVEVLHRHILIINEWVNTTPLNATRGTRKEKREDRDYARVFGAERR